MLALGIRYLTGYSVATDVASREHAEWPPHPARVFMAMAAALFETGEKTEERAALEWLEQQGPPSLAVSGADARLVVKQYVPVNDKAGPAKMTLQCLPTLTRQKAERTFPTTRPHDDTIYLVWRDAEPAAHINGLRLVCGNVTYIGHSSSLVQMWVENSPPESNLVPGDFGELQLRIPSEGTLAYLEQAFNAAAVDDYGEIKARMDAASGEEKKQLKKEFAERFGDGEPVSQRPVISIWQTYGRTDVAEVENRACGGAFDREFVILSMLDGPVIGLESTWQLMTCMHKTILEICDPAPEWVSGHTAAGTPSARPHVACFPLAFVAAPHADGHLLGIGLAIPHEIPPRERGQALGKLLFDTDGLPRELELRAGRLGKWTLVQESRPSPPVTLRNAIWTGPSHTWATVTPIVLDRHPKVERSKDREAWSMGVAEIIAESCERQGLPRPSGIDVDKTAWQLGAPRAVSGKSAGYPLMPVKKEQHPRQQVHAWLHFDQPVQGPMLLGTGRYRGYGLCRPWEGDKSWKR